MVSSQKRTVTSSAGAQLIDDLTDWLDEQIDADATLHAVRRSHPFPERLAAQVALGYFLPHATTPDIDFDPAELLRDGSLGWDLARAQARREARPNPRADSPSQDPAYRFAVVQSELYRRHLRLAVDRFDLRPLALYLRHLTQWHLEGAARRTRRASRADAARAQRSRTGTGGRLMSTLLIDNYDSYTYNVFHLLAAVSGEEPIVVHNDAISWTALSRWDFDAIVLSPGPGRPQRWHDFGVCADILRHSEIPVLGICLGHQGIGNLLSGMVGAAPEPMHGRLSRVQHENRGLFAGVPQGFSVVRYHSLAVTGSLGPEGRVTAWTDDGVVMGIEHRRRPLWGVQFHPESIATEHGRRIVENFYDRLGHRASAKARRVGSAPMPTALPSANATDDAAAEAARPLDRRRTFDGVAVRAPVRRARARFLARQRRRADAPGSVLLSRHVGRRRALRARIRRLRESRDGAPRRRHDARARLDLRRARSRARGAQDRVSGGAREGAARRLRRLPRL